MDYYLVVIGIIVIPLIAQAYINYNYKKYLKVNIKNDMNGYDTARKILDNNGLKDILILETEGTLTDHYDPSKNVIKLSSDIYHKTTIASCSVAAHECGHALQNKDGYIFMKIRTAIVPIVNLSSKFAYILLIIGFILEFSGLIELAIILMCAGVVFQLVTLPVEIDASRRAKKELKNLNILYGEENSGASKMLISAALTYVAGLISSLLEILRLLLIFSKRD